MKAIEDVMVNKIEFLPSKTFCPVAETEKAISKPPYYESKTLRGLSNSILGHQARVPVEGESKWRRHLP